MSEALEEPTTTAAVQEEVAEVSQSPDKHEDEDRAEETSTPPVPALLQHSFQYPEDEHIEDEEGDEDALSVPDDEYHPLGQQEDHQDQDQEKDRGVDAVEVKSDIVETDQVEEEVDELLSSSPLSSPPGDRPKALPQALGEDGQMDRGFESGSGLGGLFTPLEEQSGAVSASPSEALSNGDLSALESKEGGDGQVHGQVHGHDQDQEAFEDGLIDWDQVESGHGLNVKEDKPVVEEKVEEKETAEEPTVRSVPF